MASPASYNGKGHLRRSMSTRTIRRRSRTHRSSLYSESFVVDDTKHQATLAASLAMQRSAERSSMDSKRSYDSLGGPSTMAVPRRYHRSIHTEDSGHCPPSCASTERDLESQDGNHISLAALPAIDEFGSLDGRNASLPSSYRRLRKSRSMFAPRQHLSHTAYACPEDVSEKQPTTPLSQGTLRRSLSFFRGNPQPSHSIRHAKSHEAAIELARSQFNQSDLDSYGRSRQSSLSTLRPKREYRPFRRTFRTISASAVDPYNTPLSAEHYRATPSFGRARSFSSSIKRGIKRVLGWSKPPCDPAQVQTSPCQSLGQENHPTGGMDHRTELGSETETTSLQSARRKQSFESLATSSSRVTSWADSTVANTVTERRPGDRGQLSIIHERTASNQSVFHSISNGYLQRNLPSTPSPSKRSPHIDSQSLYTALMRKIGGSSRHGSDDEVVFGRVKEHYVNPTRARSAYPLSREQSIRPVPSDESIISRGSFATALGSIVTPRGPHAMFENRRFRSDARSIIFATPEGLGPLSETSSVYSRSTSGNSPSAKERNPHMDRQMSDDEPGVATIFESKRTTYSSPNRASRSPCDAQIRPSVDWKQWMNTQMQRIDKGITVRDHYREEAQIHTEEPDLSHPTQHSSESHVKEKNGSAHTPLCEEALPRKATNNNFSRPFSRACSVRAMPVTQKEPKGEATLPSASTSPSYAGQNTFSVNRTRPRSNAITFPPIQSIPSNQLPATESPTPKRTPGAMHPRQTVNMRYGTQFTRVSPDGKALSLRSTRSHRDMTKRTNENVKTEDSPGDYKDTYIQSQKNNSPMSSKRMVEMFLDSRRRQMQTEAPGGLEDAFI
ncbi:hypothetical protein BDV59DRAFT_96460 [Aspergillus ambiguus]|uniref:uncharacterized protein n=1 Tax=Aspergillus ambiguus TaxID=176160 RepID=UPI003CCE3D3E